MLFTRRTIQLQFLIALAVFGVGCGWNGPKYYSVKGKVEHPSNNVAILAGSHVEAALEEDREVRASGEIQTDGSFSLESLSSGKIRKGAQAGKYRVRLVPMDDDPQVKRRILNSLDASCLDFETSGLSFQVPTSGAIRLAVKGQ